MGQVQTVKGSCNIPAWLQHEQVSIIHVIHDLPVKVSITVGCRKLSALLYVKYRKQNKYVQFVSVIN